MTELDHTERKRHPLPMFVIRGSTCSPKSRRSLPVKPYVIYFLVIEDERVVVIRHIRRGSRRPPKASEL